MIAKPRILPVRVRNLVNKLVLFRNEEDRAIEKNWTFARRWIWLTHREY